MHLRARLPRHKASTPSAPAVAGYGCSLEGRALVCKLLSVHKKTRPRALAVTLYESEKKRRRARVRWPGLEPGVYEEVVLYLCN